ncbi:FAD:protein FMN transferase [Pseudoalteromonas sp. AOP7-A1-14]|uniref:FAD:protein FMN transferase n=1 Tax=Pseudoalteromonas TaxID=53246 RepID=UPI00384D43E4
MKPEPLAIMTSGTYRHYYDQAGNRYSHIIDARRLAPVSHSTVSVTVFHDDRCMVNSIIVPRLRSRYGCC